MPEPSAHAVDRISMEILPPVRRPSSRSAICECCRQPREASDFDQDGCGICVNCLECDDILVDLRAAPGFPSEVAR